MGLPQVQEYVPMAPVRTPLTDDDLLSMIADGNEDALSQFYDRHAAAAWGIATMVLRDRHLAEEAVQDAFVGVWKQADRFDPDRASATTWLQSIVRRRAIDRVRREEVRRRASAAARDDAMYAPDRPEAVVDPLGEALRAESNTEVEGLLGRLPDHQREVLSLALFGGFTQSEIAAQLDVPLGTVKTRMFRGLRTLRDHVESGAAQADG